MNKSTGWILKGFLPYGKVKLMRFNGGIIQEKIILQDAMSNLMRKNKYQVKGI